MRTLERYLAIGLLLTVAGAIYFAVRVVPLPEAFRIHRLVTDGEPR